MRAEFEQHKAERDLVRAEVLGPSSLLLQTMRDGRRLAVIACM